MQSSLEEATRQQELSAMHQEILAGNQELILGLAQARIVEMRGAFLPTTLEGNQSPDVGEEGHISDEADADGEPFFQSDYDL